MWVCQAWDVSIPQLSPLLWSVNCLFYFVLYVFLMCISTSAVSGISSYLMNFAVGGYFFKW